MRYFKLFLAASLMVSISSQGMAAEGNFTDVRSSLQEAEQAVERMENNDIPIERAESLLTTANRSFRAQKTLAEQGGTPDFTRVEELTGNIQEIKDTALRVNDRLRALEDRIDGLENSSLNLTGVKKAYREVNTTFHNQRFGEAENQVENVYSEISEAQSVQTQVQAFASAQRENIVGTYNSAVSYAVENWKKLSVASVFFILLAAVSFREYRLWRLEIRREDLIDKKQVIKDMIEEAQHEYYVKGKGSEISFKTRMNKFQEMKRDTEQNINALESQLKSIKGLPVISPEIKDEAKDFQAEGEIMEDKEEIKGSLERISEKREKKEDSEEENSLETDGELERVLREGSVKEGKEFLESQEKPDYRTSLVLEKENQDRKSMKEYLEDRIEMDLEDVDPGENERKALNADLKEAKDGIEDMEDPDYRKLLKAEKEGRDRKALNEYLKGKITLEN